MNNFFTKKYFFKVKPNSVMGEDGFSIEVLNETNKN